MATITYNERDGTYGIYCDEDDCDGDIAYGYGFESYAQDDATEHEEDHALDGYH